MNRLLSRLVRGRVLPWSVAVLTTVAAILFAVLWLGERAEDDRRAEVEETVRRFLSALTNFDASTIDRDVQEIRSLSIGGFAREVEETFSAERLAAIRANQATSRGRVRSIFVEVLEKDSATVFAVVDETVSNASSPEPRSDVLRVEVGLVATTEAWKVDRVEILQSPVGGLVGP